MTLDRFHLGAILILAVAVWGGILFFSGTLLSWEHARPFGFTLAALSTIIALYDKFLWAWWPFRLAHKVPHLQGTWRVELQSTYVDPETKERKAPILGYAAITQTYTKISLNLMTADSSSFLVASSIRVTGNAEVVGVYQSDPQIHLRGDVSEIHYGAFRIKVIGRPVIELEGHYWTDRITKGTVKYTDRTRSVVDSFGQASKLFLARDGG